MPADSPQLPKTITLIGYLLSDSSEETSPKETLLTLSSLPLDGMEDLKSGTLNLSKSRIHSELTMVTSML